MNESQTNKDLLKSDQRLRDLASQEMRLKLLRFIVRNEEQRKIAFLNEAVLARVV